MTVTQIIKLALLTTAAAVIVCSYLRFRKKRVEISLALGSILVVLLVAELFLRLFYPQISQHNKMFEYDPELGWRFIPDKRGAIVYPGESHLYIQTNSLGFRGDEPGHAEEGRCRVMVLGDSFVSNVAVPDEAVFTHVMQGLLPRTSVLNFGVNGYGQVQEYLLLQKWLDAVDPDLVVLVIYLRNDFLDNVGGYWLYPRPVARLSPGDSTLIISPPSPPGPDTLAVVPAWKFYRRSHLYLFIDRRLRIFADRFLGPEPGERKPSAYTPPELYLCRKEPGEETLSMFRVMDRLLLDISRFLESKDVPCLFVLAPSLLQVDDALWTATMKEFGEDPATYDATMPDERLLAFAKRNDLPIVDLLPALRAISSRDEPLYHEREQHWTVEGNRVVAEILSAQIRKLGLPPADGDNCSHGRTNRNPLDSRN